MTSAIWLTWKHRGPVTLLLSVPPFIEGVAAGHSRKLVGWGLGQKLHLHFFSTPITILKSRRLLY